MGWETRTITATTTPPLLRDFICPECGKGTGRVGRSCLDCSTRRVR